MLKVDDIKYSVGNKRILQGISAEFKSGQLHVIVGPNGSGKSTFLKIFSGELNQFDGKVWYNDSTLSDIKRKTLSQYRAVMSQQSELGFPLTVEEVVMMGRYPHFQFNPGRKDGEICQKVMERMDLLSFRERNYLTLSGGEKQRVQFARAMAQIWETPEQGNRYLFLDEPLNNLDINYQQEFLKLAVEFSNGHTVMIAILHDLNHALAYGDRVIFMKEGRIAYDETPKTVSADIIRDVFGVNSTMIHPDVISHPVVIYR